MGRREVLGLIPARGGSKGIPRKNLALLAGKPLLAYTCEAALSSRHLTRLVVSTEDTEIAAAAHRLGIETIVRPEMLARDDTPMLDVVRHTFQVLAAQDEYGSEIVVLLQPTSPLRRAEHIDGAIELLIESGADAVVSVVEVPHNFTPGSLMCSDKGRLIPFTNEPAPVLRQQKPRLYARNGPAVLATRTESVGLRSLYEGDVRAYVMQRDCSIDIDDEIDLQLAEFWLTRGAAPSVGSHFND